MWIMWISWRSRCISQVFVGLFFLFLKNMTLRYCSSALDSFLDLALLLLPSTFPLSSFFWTDPTLCKYFGLLAHWESPYYANLLFYVCKTNILKDLREAL